MRKIEIKDKQKLYLDIPTEFKSGKLLDLEFNVIKGGELNLFLVANATNQEKISVKVTVKHEAPDAVSNVHMNAVVQDQSDVTFYGGMVVAEGIEKVSTQLHQRAMLLSDQAKVRLDPVLEIDDNRLTGAHSAVISSPSKEQMNYMQTRGISEVLAKSIIAKSLLQRPDDYKEMAV